MTRELTGRHVLAIMLGAFGTIIAVNVFMAFQAVSTFPGLEVRNSYVASQSFDRDRAAQEKLGWTVTPDYDGKVLTVAIRDADGLPARLTDMELTIGRPTHVREDQTPLFTYENGVFRAPITLGPGAWIIHISAIAADGTPFRQRLDHFNGARIK